MTRVHASKPWIAALSGVALLAAAAGAETPARSSHQTVYVPVYSEVPFGDRSGTLLVRSSVVVRNTDTERALTIVSARYHDSQGALLRDLVKEPIVVAPLGSTRFDVPESETAGGISPSLLVRWQAEQPIVAPLVESLTITTYQGQGVSFLGRGQVVGP